MNVVQYKAKFRALERIVEDLLPTKQQRVERFYEGMHYEICVVLIGRTFATFGDVVQAVGEAK